MGNPDKPNASTKDWSRCNFCKPTYHERKVFWLCLQRLCTQAAAAVALTLARCHA